MPELLNSSARARDQYSRSRTSSTRHASRARWSAQFKYALPLEESIKHLFARPDFVDSLSWDNLPQKSPWINAVQMLHLSR